MVNLEAGVSGSALVLGGQDYKDLQVLLLLQPQDLVLEVEVLGAVVGEHHLVGKRPNTCSSCQGSRG